MANNQQPTEAQKKEQSEILGKKLGVLIAALKTDEQKSAILNLLPHMNAEQLIELTKILESKFTEAATADLDKKLEADLTMIKKDFVAKQSHANAQAMNALDSLDKQLDKLSK